MWDISLFQLKEEGQTGHAGTLPVAGPFQPKVL